MAQRWGTGSRCSTFSDLACQKFDTCFTTCPTPKHLGHLPLSAIYVYCLLTLFISRQNHLLHRLSRFFYVLVAHYSFIGFSSVTQNGSFDWIAQGTSLIFNMAMCYFFSFTGGYAHQSGWHYAFTEEIFCLEGRKRRTPGTLYFCVLVYEFILHSAWNGQDKGGTWEGESGNEKGIWLWNTEEESRIDGIQPHACSLIYTILHCRCCGSRQTSWRRNARNANEREPLKMKRLTEIFVAGCVINVCLVTFCFIFSPAVMRSVLLCLLLCNLLPFLPRPRILPGLFWRKALKTNGNLHMTWFQFRTSPQPRFMLWIGGVYGHIHCTTMDGWYANSFLISDC